MTLLSSYIAAVADTQGSLFAYGQVGETSFGGTIPDYPFIGRVGMMVFFILVLSEKCKAVCNEL